MKRMLLLALAVLAVRSSATAPLFPQMRMTPQEIVSGNRGDSQIGSSKRTDTRYFNLADDPESSHKH